MLCMYVSLHIPQICLLLSLSMLLFLCVRFFFRFLRFHFSLMGQCMIIYYFVIFFLSFSSLFVFSLARGVAKVRLLFAKGMTHGMENVCRISICATSSNDSNSNNQILRINSWNFRAIDFSFCTKR